jgi:hypothetical protein
MEKRHLIITVHGIRTFGDWQRRLEQLIHAKSPDISVYHFVYGYFSMIGFIVPLTRWLVVRRFRRELISLVRRSNPTRVDIVAHSFGTHLAAWALRQLPPDEKLQIHTLVFAGSVLRSDFYWADLFPKRLVRVVNDCATRDLALIPSQFLVPFTGMAGRTGFVGMTGPEFCNRYSAFGHSGYFKDATGQVSNEYMLSKWIPLFLQRGPIDLFDDRKAPTPWRGLSIWLVNNFEPIKLIFLLTPVLAALIWVSALYIEAKAAKQRIEGAIGLGQIMKAQGQLNPGALSLLETMTNTLHIPLQKTYALWVDDNPEANILERGFLSNFSLCFDRVGTTADALKLLKPRHRYSFIISDYTRKNDKQAGYGLLDEMKKQGISLPYIFYVDRRTQSRPTTHGQGERRQT